MSAFRWAILFIALMTNVSSLMVPRFEPYEPSSVDEELPEERRQEILQRYLTSEHFVAHLHHNRDVAPKALLRRDWRSGVLSNPLAKDFYRTQNPADCTTNKFGQFIFPVSGFGSDLHVWANVLCKAHTMNTTLVTAMSQTWIWWDRQFCGPESHQTKFECYFGRETQCDVGPTEELTPFDYWNQHTPGYHGIPCPHADATAAAIELLFKRLPDRVLSHAESAALQVFGSSGAPVDSVTVNVRWGDRNHDGRSLHPISHYIAAVNAIVESCKLPTNLVVFIMTEDPAALRAFQMAAPSSWAVRWYADAVGGGPQNRNENDTIAYSVMDDAVNTGGSRGLHSLIALILSLESRYFVIGSSSNWSQLLSELLGSHMMRAQDGCESVIDVDHM